MEESDWQAFVNYSRKYYKDYNYKQYETLTDSRANLNRLWIKLKEILITTAHKTVPITYRSSEDLISKPKALTSCYTSLKKLNVILLAFRIKFLTRQLWPDLTRWAEQLVTIQQVIVQHKIDPVDFPQVLTTDNVRQVKAQLLTIFKLIYQKPRQEQRLMENKQIQHHIQLRCHNYDEDLTQMIDSILNRKY